MNTILQYALKLAAGRYVLGALAKIHNGLNGKRSEIAAVLLGIVHILKLAEVIPAQSAAQLEAVLLALLPVTLADRAAKLMKTAEKVSGHDPAK